MTSPPTGTNGLPRLRSHEPSSFLSLVLSTWASMGGGRRAAFKHRAPVAGVLKCLDRAEPLLPGPPGTQARSKSQSGHLLGSRVDPWSPEPGEGPCSAPSHSQEASPERHPCLASLVVLARYWYYSMLGANHSPPYKEDTLASVLPGAPPSPSSVHRVGCKPPKTSPGAVLWPPSQCTSVQ